MIGVREVAARVRSSSEGPDGPVLAWTLRGYRPAQVSGDVVAGLTVAALIVPLSIGYAAVAGLPPEMGLYASVAPLVMYAIFGSGRRVILGPDAASASMIAATIAPLAAAQDDRVRLASALGLLVALLFVGMRVARMGFLADFLSRPILVGYMTGVGLTVAVGQVEKMLGGPVFADALSVLRGIDLAATEPAAVLEALGVAVSMSGADLPSIVLGFGTLVAILLGRRFLPWVPMALPALIVALVLSAALDLQSEGVRVLGPVPAGLPPVGLPSASLTELLALIPGALGLAILTFADTSATGRSFASRNGERTEANRELVALAAADAAGALTGGYPVSSSPSRTAASEGAGSSSGMAGIIAAAAVLVVLVLLTAPLAYLPMPALGAVIFASVLGLMDFGALRGIWRVKRSEGAIALVAMAGVILYGTLVGVVIAVLLAALNIVRRAAAPPIVEEVRRPDGTWRDAARARDGSRVRGVVIVRFAGPLFFANATALATRVRGLVAERDDATAVVLDLGATSNIDLTAADTIRDMERELARDGRRLAVARPLGHVREELRIFGLESLMDAAAGTRGSVDTVIRGLGLDPAVAPLAPALPAGPPGTASEAGDAEAGGMAAPVAAQVVDGNRVVLRVIGVAAACVVGAVVLGLVVANRTGAPLPGPATAPNLVGMPLTRAEVAASDAGFELIAPIYVRRDDVPEGTVVGQDPQAGTVMDSGSEIQPVVGTGRQLVFVPEVVGRPEAEAIVALTSAGLQVRRLGSAYDAALPVGAVVSTDPVAGTSVASGTSVAYLVSAGPEPVAPDTSPSAIPSATLLPATAPPTPPTPEPTPTPTPTPAPTAPPSSGEPGSSEPPESTTPDEAPTSASPTP
jgi:high affinity sulfate transporter 1